MLPLIQRLARYVAWHLEEFPTGFPEDGGDIQDKAVELGILLPKDPEEARACRQACEDSSHGKQSYCACYQEAGVEPCDDAPCYYLNPEISALVEGEENG